MRDITIGYKAFLYHRYKAQGKLKTKKPILNFIEAKPKLVAPPPVAETLQLILPNGQGKITKIF